MDSHHRAADRRHLRGGRKVTINVFDLCTAGSFVILLLAAAGVIDL